MPRELKNWGGRIFISSRPDQTRVCVKAPSKKLAADLFGVSMHEFNNFFSVTINEVECAALDQLPPGTVIYNRGKEHERIYRTLPWQIRHFTDKEMVKVHPVVLKNEYDAAWQQSPKSEDDRRYWIRYLDRLRDALDERKIT